METYLIQLPDVTFTMIETMEHALGRLAVNDCVTKAKFAEVVIFTDKPELFEPLECDAKFVTVPNWPTKEQWSKFSWHGVHEHVRTPFTLHVQWDSAIWDESVWSDEYLDYDLTGAIWPWHPDRKVGNLGFSLRSTRIIRYIATHRDKFPIINAVDDDLVCRRYRAALEELGFVWAPERLAERFAFECALPDLERRHFGWHAAQNFKYVLDHDQLLERGRLMQQSNYLGKRNSYIWQNFCKACPEIVAELSC